MAKGQIITGPIEAQIVKVYMLHPKWTALMVRHEVERIMQKEAKARGKPPPPTNWPGLSTVQKVLAIKRSYDRKMTVDPQDGRWSLATLDNYPIDPQALPRVIELWKLRKHNITIRKAKWIARLSPLFSNLLELDEAARDYVREEQIYESLGETFDSHVIDGNNIDPELSGYDIYILGMEENIQTTNNESGSEL